MGSFLAVFTGGLAAGDLEFSQSIRDLADPCSRLSGTKSQNKIGWMVGAGLQYAIAEHWSARVQYQHVALGSVDFDSHVNAAPEFRGHHEANFSAHNATAALIYQF